ncbi:hypothetical protein GOBAR_DD05588 [Gossypium barbadense]|nr:hypothetical protein GOBAR_DD05588 [Gossypium barbadense]
MLFSQINVSALTVTAIILNGEVHRTQGHVTVVLIKQDYSTAESITTLLLSYEMTLATSITVDTSRFSPSASRWRRMNYWYYSWLDIYPEDRQRERLAAIYVLSRILMTSSVRGLVGIMVTNDWGLLLTRVLSFSLHRTSSMVECYYGQLYKCGEEWAPCSSSTRRPNGHNFDVEILFSDMTVKLLA